MKAHFSLKLSASSTSMSLGSASGKAAASCWLRLGEEVAGSHLSVCVFIRPELKFEPGYFHPCWLHVSDVSHEVFVLLTRQLSDFERRHCLWCINVCSFHCCRICELSESEVVSCRHLNRYTSIAHLRLNAAAFSATFFKFTIIIVSSARSQATLF